MIALSRSLLLFALLAAVAVGGVCDSLAQTPKRPVPRLNGPPIPETPEQRTKLLQDLYAHLATAADEVVAAQYSEAIERLWLFSGSDTVSLLMERSLKAASERNLDLAQQLLDAVVELAPDFAEGWNRRAYISYLQGANDRALGDLRRALALDPSHYKALDGLGIILRELGEKKAALKAYRQLLSVHPHWPGAQTSFDELAREVEGQGI